MLFFADTPGRLAILFFRFIQWLISFVTYIITGNLLTGFIPIIMILLGAMLLNTTAANQQFLDLAEDVANLVVDVKNFLTDLVEQLIECKESPVTLRNQIVRFILAIIWRVSEVIATYLGDDFELWEWADPDYEINQCDPVTRSSRNPIVILSKAEQQMRDLAYEEEWARVRPFYEEDIRSYTGKDPVGYAHRVFRRMDREVKKTVGGGSKEKFFPELIETFCEIIEAVIGFILDVLEILRTGILTLLDIFLGAFSLRRRALIEERGFDLSFIEGIALWLAKAILGLIPFTCCFLDLDQLDSIDPETIIDIMVDVWRYLIPCLAPWAYNSCLQLIPCIYDNCGMVDNPGTAIVKALCIINGGRIEFNDNPIQAIIKCANIDVLITAFNFIKNTVVNILEPAFNGLKLLYEGLKNTVLNLWDKFTDILGKFNRIKDLFRRRRFEARERGEQFDSEEEELWNRIDEIFDEVNEMKEEGHRQIQLLNATSEEADRLAIQVRDAVREVAGIEDADIGTRAQRRWNDYLAQREVREGGKRERKIEELPKVSKMLLPLIQDMIRNARYVARGSTDDLRDSLYELTNRAENGTNSWALDFTTEMRMRFGEDGGEHAHVITETLRDLLHSFRFSISGNHKMHHINKHMAKVDFRKATRSLQTLAARSRRAEGRSTARDEHYLERSVHRSISRAALTVAAAVGGKPSFYRIHNWFKIRLGEDSEALKRSAEDVRAGWFEITDAAEAAVTKVKNMKKERAEAKRQVIDQTFAAQMTRNAYENGYKMVRDFTDENWEKIDNWAHDHAEAYPENTRVVVIGVALGAGGVALSVVASGAVLGAGLGFCAVFGVAVVAIVFGLVAAFLIPVLTTGFEILTGIINNALGADPKRFDFFSPFIVVVGDRFISLYTQEPSLLDLQDDIFEMGDILLDNIQYIVNLQIRSFLCVVPLGIKPYTCPPRPVVDDDARPTQTIPDYLLDVIFFNQDCPCSDFNQCRSQGRCRAPVDFGAFIEDNDWRQFETSSDNPGEATISCIDAVCDVIAQDYPILAQQCTGSTCVTTFRTGKCTSWPIMDEGLFLDIWEVETIGEIRCDRDLELDLEPLKYYNGDGFKEAVLNGEWYRWPLYADFWGLSQAIAKDTWTISKFVTRLIVKGGSFRWIGSFVGIAGSVVILPGPVGIFIGTAVIVVNTLSDTANEIGILLIGGFERGESLPLVASLFTELLTAVRSPDWETNPPFGQVSGLEWLCGFAFLPAFLIGFGVFLELLIILRAFLLSGGFWLWASIFLETVLFPLNLLILVIRTSRYAGKLRAAQIVTEADFEGAPTMRSGMDMAAIDHNKRPPATTSKVRVGNRYVYRTVGIPRQRPVSWVDSAAFALKTGARLLLSPTFWYHAAIYRPLRTTEAPKPMWSPVRLSEHLHHARHDAEFPYTMHIQAEPGVPIVQSRRHAVVY